MQNGAEGVVFGILNADGSVNAQACKRILEITGGVENVFHRAFDVVKDPFYALDELIKLGFNRILTKGQKNSLKEGSELIKALKSQANGRVKFYLWRCSPTQFRLD